MANTSSLRKEELVDAISAASRDGASSAGGDEADLDSRKLNFFYQEERKDGNQSTFFRLESPDREDA